MIFERVGTQKLFQLAVMAAVIGLIAREFLVRVRFEQEMAEKLVVESTVRNIASGIRWAQAERMVRGGSEPPAALVRRNPIEWLRSPPAGFRPEVPGCLDMLGPGEWAFAAGARELVYRPRLREHLVLEDDEGCLRWRLEVAADANDPQWQWVKLTLRSSYRWFY